ncbi:hypothetical protein MNBD_CPR01-472 [hydrothermal vent metagenome]|uniref:Uncharacterized protein n=1 Tax=hydrothermal vent metagenome TaxID=652676 RepID=A0A3B0V8D3_9ZZZZ
MGIQSESAVEVFQSFKKESEIEITLEAPNFKSLLNRIGSKCGFESFVSFLEQWRNTCFGVEAHSEDVIHVLSPVIVDKNQRMWRITAINRPNGWFVGASEL